MKMAFSLVIPAHNETDRLPDYLGRIRTYLPDHFGEQYEVIIVDDGSSDGLIELLDRTYGDWPQLRVLRHASNFGKGAAVRTGVLAAEGDVRLFADADGATPIEEEHRLRAAIAQGADLAIGSRLLPAKDVTCQRTRGRAMVGRAFAGVARTLFHLSIRDTQCGFKMFRADVVAKLFEGLHERGYLFDLELLIHAKQLGCRIAEVPVNWMDVPGSRLSLWRQLLPITAGLWRLHRYRAKAGSGGIYRNDPPDELHG